MSLLALLLKTTAIANAAARSIYAVIHLAQVGIMLVTAFMRMRRAY